MLLLLNNTRCVANVNSFMVVLLISSGVKKQKSLKVEPTIIYMLKRKLIANVIQVDQPLSIKLKRSCYYRKLFSWCDGYSTI